MRACNCTRAQRNSSDIGSTIPKAGLSGGCGAGSTWLLRFAAVGLAGVFRIISAVFHVLFHHGNQFLVLA
jgi:hypothetical protein